MNPDLDQEILKLAGELQDADAESAARLTSLAAAVSPTGDASGWAGIDVLRAINPVGTSARVREKLLVDRGLARAEFWRNALVMLPIALTWFGLMYAALGYQAAIHADPNLISRPFLLLWEEGFDGHLASPLSSLSWLTFSHLAFVDVAVLSLVVLLTWLIHRKRNLQQVNSDIEANALQQRLHHLAWQASQVIASRVTPVAIADQFRQTSEGLLDALAAYREEIAQLAGWRERQVADFDQFSTDLRQSGAILEPLIVQVHDGLRLLGSIVASLEERMTRLEGADRQLENALSATSKDLHYLVTTTEQGVRVTSDVVSGVGLFKAELGDLRSLLIQERHAYEAAAESACRAADAVQQAVSSTIGVVPAVQALKTEFARIPTEIQRVAELQEQAATSMRDSADELAKVTSTLVSTMNALARTSLSQSGSASRPQRRWLPWIG